MTSRGVDRLAFWGLLLLALLLRLHVGTDTTYLVHPDETYDYLEQGFRLAFGYGVKTWTYQYGLRSYLFPGFLAGIMRAAAWIDPSPRTYLNAVAAVMSLLSLSVVVTSWLWGRFAAGRIGALLAGFIAAVWFELIYFAPRTLSEVIATNALVLGAWLAGDEAAPPSRRRLVWSGVMLGLVFVLRVQLVPALAVIGLWLLVRRGWRAPAWIAAGALLPVVAAAILDWITYGMPLQSVVMNVYANTLGGVSAYYGHLPLTYFLSVEASYQNGAIGLVALTALLGAFRLPRLALIAASIIVTHSLIGWKEYRFIYPALPFVFALSGIGTAMLVEMLLRGQRRLGAAPVCAVALGLWAVTSGALALEGPFAREWDRRSGEIAAARVIAARHDVCGIAAYGIHMSALPGYVRLHHDVPLYILSDPARFPTDAASFDVVIAHDDHLPPGTLFHPLGCWADGTNTAAMNRRMPSVCVLVRPGPCHPGAVSDPDPDRPPGW